MMYKTIFAYFVISNVALAGGEGGGGSTGGNGGMSGTQVKESVVNLPEKIESSVDSELAAATRQSIKQGSGAIKESDEKIEDKNYRKISSEKN